MSEFLTDHHRAIACALFRLSISKPPKPDVPISLDRARREFARDAADIATVLNRLDCKLSEIEMAIEINAGWAAYWAVHHPRGAHRTRFAAIAARQRRTLRQMPSRQCWGNA